MNVAMHSKGISYESIKKMYMYEYQDLLEMVLPIMYPKKPIGDG